MWYYQGNIFTEDMIGNNYGFIYCIEHIPSGKKYIGRKFFTRAATKQVKGRKKKIRKSSDWQDYYGSGDLIQEAVEQFGKDSFRRTILYLCKTLGETKYMETKILFEHDVLRAKLPNGEYAYYNGNIMMKYTRRNIG